jgi:hypothetical protein
MVTKDVVDEKSPEIFICNCVNVLGESSSNLSDG